MFVSRRIVECIAERPYLGADPAQGHNLEGVRGWGGKEEVQEGGNIHVPMLLYGRN